MPTPIPLLVPTGFQPVPEAARVNLPYGGVTRVRHGFPERNDGISSASQLPAGCLRQKSGRTVLHSDTSHMREAEPRTPTYPINFVR